MASEKAGRALMPRRDGTPDHAASWAV